MSSDNKSTNTPHWKGQSRVLKLCHWCSKKQEPGPKTFQACGRCKEVIYCSKECQVASWPFHKGPCKISSDAKKATEGNPAAATTIANFKKWHSLHLGSLRHAAICALDLGNDPKAVDQQVVFIEVKLKHNHKDLPLNRRYEPVGGFTLTISETRKMLGPLGGNSVLDGIPDANAHIRNKGGLGVATVVMQAHDMVDIVKVILPSPSATKQAQQDNNWGQKWLECFTVAVETD